MLARVTFRTTALDAVKLSARKWQLLPSQHHVRPRIPKLDRPHLTMALLRGE